MKVLKLISIFTLWLLICVNPLIAQVTALPLIQIENLDYEGAFIIPSKEFGESSANYSTGIIAYNSDHNSLFLSGHNTHGAIAEFSIPTLVNSTDITQINTAIVLQNFRRLLNQSANGNPQGIDIISGMELINNKLMVNAMEYYDAPADNTHTTLVLENPSNLSTSGINGYYKLNGAAHAGGWVSKIPSEWQTVFEGDHISGNSSKHPINSRHSMGPSAFVFDSNDITNNTLETIPTTTLLDFDLTNPLYADYNSYENANYNLTEINGNTASGHTFEDANAIVGKNNLWTEESQASYGFIIPRSRTYLTIGSSGGHHSGIGYKPTQNNGYLCPGPCAYNANDYYNYYWLWDVNDLLEVKNGTLNPYEVRPYASGILEIPFQIDAYSSTPEFHPISGGTYDPEKGLLYLSVYDGGAINNQYEKNPIIVAYKINDVTLSTKKPLINTIKLSPNPVTHFLTLAIEQNNIEKVVIYNNIGQLIKESNLNKINVSQFVSGIYFIHIFSKNSKLTIKKFIKN